ncbi:MAG: type IV pilus assembly protein PilM [Planctomycetota bacterium]|jgi:type IV pilus assembly protein PilM
MASKSNTVWAIDLGNNSLKALRLSTENGVAEVIGFDNIEHGKILTGASVTQTERDELIALSLRQFVRENDLSGDEIVVSVPSQNSFARFVNLPPVESKRIPEIVKFEAAQQIPFDINEVQWDWQLMTEGESPDNRVGIFAIKNEVVNSALSYFSVENLTVSCVQMAPMGLYNYALYDRPDLVGSDRQGIVVLDIGAENTDLVVCTKSSVWQRCIPMGGNAFTKAIAEAFKLSFDRAEKLKRTAPMSKYARQIFQAMRPVFTDLASEIQRSLGFYTSSNPNTKLLKVIAFGGGTKMRGLLKYLRQTLQISVERPDSFKKLGMGQGVSAAKFHENVPDFGTVYGLALQGLGLAKIESNLLPRNVARSMTWASKAKYFTAAASLLLVASVLAFGRTMLDKATYGKRGADREEASRIVEVTDQTVEDLRGARAEEPVSQGTIQKAFEPLKHRDVIPSLLETIISMLPNEKYNSEQAQLYKAFASGDVETLQQMARKERKQIFVTGWSVRYSEDIGAARFQASTLQGLGGSKKDKKEGWDDEEEYERELRAAGGGGARPKYKKKFFIKGKTGVVTEEAKPGFLVTIAGYSPYGNLGELMDPTDVEDNPNWWGFITRLRHLDEVVDGNSAFKLYDEIGHDHFKLEGPKPVDLATEMPVGIGVKGKAAGNGDAVVLIDPMTREVISKVAKLDERGRPKLDPSGRVVHEINDHWFILNVKFVWKDAPKETTAGTSDARATSAPRKTGNRKNARR